MSITRYMGDRLFGLSSDTKPLNIRDGAEFFQYDTRQQFYKISGSWVEFTASGLSSSALSGYSIIRNGITGSGTLNYLTQFVSPSGIGNSPILNSGISVYLLGSSFVGIGQSPTLPLDCAGGIATRPGLVNLVNVSSLSPSNRSYIKISSDSQVSTDRRFNLLPGATAGHLMVLEWGTGSGMLPNNTGASSLSRLSADWIPDSGHTLSLIYNGSEWIELARRYPSTGFLSGISSASSFTNGITGIGTSGYLPIFSGTSALTTSAIRQVSSSYYLAESVGFMANNLLRNPSSLTVNSPLSSITASTDFVKILSNSSGIASERIVTVGGGLIGGDQKLLVCGSGTFTVPNSGLLRLVADWVPVSGGILKLAYETSPTNIWREEYRFPPYTGFLSGISVGSSIVNGVTGSGTVNYLSVFVDNSGIGNSFVYQSGTNYGFGKNNPSEQIEITGNLKLPTSTEDGSAGVIKIGPNTQIHNRGFNCVAMGESAGLHKFNSNTVSIGISANNTGYSESAVFIGYRVGLNNNYGDASVCIGHEVLRDIQTGFFNVGIGYTALRGGSASTADRIERCVGIGYAALSNLAGTVYDSTAVGSSALGSAQEGQNTAFGANAGRSLKYGQNNIAVGYQAMGNFGGTKNYTGTITIGIGIEPTGNNCFTLGNITSDYLLLGGNPGINKVFTCIDTTGSARWMDSSTAFGSLLTNTITGQGTVNYLPVFTSNSGIGSSLAYQSGSNIVAPNYAAQVSGVRLTGTNNLFTVDFDSTMYQTGMITGNVSFNSLNRGPGKSVVCRLFASGTNALTFAENWTWMGDNPPTNMIDQKNMIVSLTSLGTAASDVFATFAVQA